MRSLINLRIKSKINFTINKFNEEITLSNINCYKEKKKLSQKNINEEKKIQLAHIDVHS